MYEIWTQFSIGHKYDLWQMKKFRATASTVSCHEALFSPLHWLRKDPLSPLNTHAHQSTAEGAQLLVAGKNMRTRDPYHPVFVPNNINW